MNIVGNELKAVRPFGKRDMFGYAMGDFGCNMSFQLFSVYLLVFATQGLHIIPWHWTIIVLVAKIFDAFNDPIIGALVDNKKPGKNGKFRPWILYGALAVALTTVLMFINVDSFPYWGKFAYVLVMYCLWSIAYTMVNVPYGSLNAALTDDPDKRAGLSSFRSIGAALAMLPITIVVPLVVYGKKDPVTKVQPIFPDRYVWIALACGVIAIIGFLLTYFLTVERHVVPKSAKFDFKRTIKAFFKNRAAVGMCLASFSQLVFVMSYSITLPLICQFYFKDADIQGVLSVIMMLPMLLLMPFMGRLTKRWGARTISLWPNLLAVGMLVFMLFVPFDMNRGGAFLFAAMLGVALLMGAPFMLATWSMVADCVDQQEVTTGHREEGSVYAVYSFFRKVAQGVGSAFVILCLSAVGYSENLETESLTVIDTVAPRMLKISILLPLIGFALVFLALLLIYNLTKRRVEGNVAYLRDRHLAIAEAGKVRELFSDIGDEQSVSHERNNVVDAAVIEENIGLENVSGYETAGQIREMETADMCKKGMSDIREKNKE